MTRAIAIALALNAALVAGSGCGPSRPEPVVVAADSRVELAFTNELGGSFVLMSVELRLDGELVGEQVSTVPAGEHEVSVRARYRGEGHGIFSYLKEYKFDVKSKHTFRAPPLKTIAITAVCFERGGPTTELSDRPAIRWVEETR
jgi:hypothetical protein